MQRNPHSSIQEYRSIATQHDARELISKLDVKKSSFLAYGAHVTSKDEARAFCAQVAKMHHDARHVCFAWVLADGAYQFSDDGEPAQTAGLPLYTLLQHQHMEDVALCIVRYFGGILLGTGGLTRAYTEAAQLALRMLEQAGALSEWRLVHGCTLCARMRCITRCVIVYAAIKAVSNTLNFCKTSTSQRVLRAPS